MDQSLRRKRVPDYCNSTILDTMPYQQHPEIFDEVKHRMVFPAQQQTLPFLTLPPEVRIKIYRLHLVLPVPMELHAKDNLDYMYVESRTRLSMHRFYQHMIGFRSLNLGLLRTCKIVREEAAEIFYGENEFRFSDSQGSIVAAGFLHKIGQFNVRFLRSITIPMPLEKSRRALDGLGGRSIDDMIKRICDIAPYHYPHDLRDFISLEEAFGYVAARLVNAPRLSKLGMVFPIDHYDTDRELNVSIPRTWHTIRCLFAAKPSLHLGLIRLYHHGHDESEQRYIDSSILPGYYASRARWEARTINQFRHIANCHVIYARYSDIGYWEPDGHYMEDNDTYLDGMKDMVDGNWLLDFGSE